MTIKSVILTLIYLLFFLFTLTGFSRDVLITYSDTTEVDTLKTAPLVADSLAEEEQGIMIWTEKNVVGLNMNEVAFINWNAGGNNSISAIFHGNFQRIFRKDLFLWRNEAIVRYGLNAQEGRELRKTEDQIAFNSTAGWRRDSVSNFRYSAKFNFNTQLANGYRYPNTDRAISKFMAPGYIFLGVGAEYTHPEENLIIYLSPITQKTTFVLDRRLANEGMFGVRPAIRDDEGNIIEDGERVRAEFGILFTSSFAKEIFENIKLVNNLSLYTDYLNRFGNIDVDWELNVDLIVNDFVKASIGSHLRYDNDVKFKKDVDGDGKLETLGARIQFKQMLGVGVIYEF